MSSDDDHPRSRATDRTWGRLLYWWRNVVPLLAIVLAAYAVIGTERTADRALHNSQAAKELASENRQILREINETRKTAIVDACRADVAQDDVLRAILDASLDARRRRFGEEEYRRSKMIAARLMRPLGGLKPLTQKRITRRCDRRVERGLP